MKKYNYAVAIDKGCSIALGAFDGLHIGHMKLIDICIDSAKLHKIKSCVYTFSNLPFKGKYITSNLQKENILNNKEVDILVFEEFSENYKNISPNEFMEKYLRDKLNAKVITVGFNYTFGKNGEGNVKFISKFCLENNIVLNIVPPVLYKEEIVSSSRIKRCVENNQLQYANEMLGRNFSVIGTVVHGDCIGATIGFPTANIMVDENHIMPPNGVYATITTVNGKKYNSLTNYGGKPTIKNNINNIETNIFNFNDDIYGSTIEVEFIEKIREIKKFNSKEELSNQILHDKEYAFGIFSK